MEPVCKVARGRLAENSVIEIIICEMKYEITPNGQESIWENIPIAPVNAPKAIAQGTSGKTKGFTKNEIKETNPDILISSGKTKNWTAKVDATISLMPNFCGIYLPILFFEM